MDGPNGQNCPFRTAFLSSLLIRFQPGNGNYRLPVHYCSKSKLTAQRAFLREPGMQKNKQKSLETSPSQASKLTFIAMPPESKNGSKRKQNRFQSER